MLVGIEGNVGTGKTVFAVRCAKRDYLNGKKLITNFELFDLPFEKFHIKKMFDKEYRKHIVNATVIIDEITVYMDCRLPTSKQNLLMGYLVLQSRKRNIDIYYTTQSFSLVDYNRLIRYTDIMIHADKMYIKSNGRIIERENYRTYTMIDNRRYNNNITQFNMNIQPYYDYYDTDEIIEPEEMLNKE